MILFNQLKLADDRYELREEKCPYFRERLDILNSYLGSIEV
jgi:hypothetical protein